MTSSENSREQDVHDCPGEERLVGVVDGDACDDALLDHLAGCDDCRALLGRSEAALRYALGGLADGELRVEARETAPRVPVTANHPRLLLLGALAAVVLVAALLDLRSAPPVARPGTPAPAAETARGIAAGGAGVVDRPVTTVDPDAARLRAVAERIERLLAGDESPGIVAEERERLALAALATAQTRGDVLGAAARDRALRGVVERYPGTRGSEVAAARLAAREESR